MSQSKRISTARQAIRNRIVAHSEEDPGKLIANPLNFRRHPDTQRAALRGSMKELGWIKSVLVNRTTGNVIDGHARCEEAKACGATVPVDWVEMTPEEERLALAVLDPITEMATRDDEALGRLLADVEAQDEGLRQMLADLATSANVGATSGLLPGVDEDDVPEPPAEPVTKRGDVWILGRHRLMCGDSTVTSDVGRLLGNVKPLLMVTDPPYGVEYDADWRNRADRANGKPYGASAIGKVSNDSQVDWRQAWSLFPGEVAYVWHAGRHASAVQVSLEACSFDIRCQIIWAKPRFVISRGHYHWQHEPCWYAVRKGGSGHWTGDRSQTTLWAIAHNKSETGHSTQKPVEAMRRPILNNSSPGQAVYEPFAGSGTTLIACETEGRSCYAMELDPLYCDIIVKRWENATGQKATLEA